MLEEDKFLQKILVELEAQKRNGKKGLFKVGIKIPQKYGMKVKEYFKNKNEYLSDIRRCSGCTNTWDIIILFKKSKDLDSGSL